MMLQHQFSPDIRAYEQFYLSQVGGNAFFDGYLPHMQGYGLGGILGKVFKFAMPIVQRGLRFLAPHAARVGSQVLSDVTSGENFGHSLKQRGSEALAGISQELLSKLHEQEGKGRKRRGAQMFKRAPPQKVFKAIKMPRVNPSISHMVRGRGRRQAAAHQDIFGQN